MCGNGNDEGDDRDRSPFDPRIKPPIVHTRWGLSDSRWAPRNRRNGDEDQKPWWLPYSGVLLVLAILLGGCGEGNVLEQGEVVERRYDDPDTWTTYGSICIARDAQTGVCTFSMPTSNTHHDGPHWELRVVGFDSEGKERREWHEVTETLYELGQVGVTVNFPQGRVVPR